MDKVMNTLRKIVPDGWFSKSSYDTSSYFHLHAGQGGIYNFPITYTNQDGSGSKVMAIGTYGCRTDVAIYLPLDSNKTRYFAARIDARTIVPDDQDAARGGTGRGDRPNSGHGSNSTSSTDSEVHPTDGQGKALKKAIRKKLAAELPEIAKDGYSEDLKPFAVVCPWPYVKHARAVGDWITEAVVEFFGLDMADVKREAKRAQGFVADVAHRHNSQTKRLRWTGEGGAIKTPDLDDDMDSDPKTFRERWPEQKPQALGWYACNGPSWSLEFNDEGWEWSTGNVPK